MTINFTKGRQILENPLDYPLLPKRKRDRQRLQIYIYPSFEPYRSWHLLEGSEGLFLRRLTWNQREPSLEPITYGAEVAADSCADLLEDLKSIRLSSLPSVDKSICIDGVEFGFGYFSGAAEVRVTWNNTPPVEFENLSKWIEMVVSRFEKILPSSSI